MNAPAKPVHFVRSSPEHSALAQKLRREVRDMKELVADLTLENRVLKKSMIGTGGEQE